MAKTSIRALTLDAGIAAALTTLLILYVFLPIAGSFTSPWAAGDMLSTYVAADNWGVLSYSTTTEYGYPLGMNINYFPGLDITENMFAKVVNLISGNPFLGINLLLFLSFPITAALTVVALRLVKSTGPIAIMLAIAFAVIPYHWGRGLGHTYLATNYSVVAGVILALLIGTGRFNRAFSEKRKLQLVGVAGLALITAWSGVYYAVFALILMAAAVLWRFAQRDRFRTLAINTFPIFVTLAFVVIGFLPGAITTFSNPPFEVLSERMPYESVMFAGFLITAMLPAPIFPGSILEFYNSAVTNAVNAAPAFENRAPTNFGTLVTSAAVLLLIVGLLLRARSTQWKKTTQQLPLISYLLTVSVLFFIPWGLNYLFAGLITAQIRAWNRFLPVILLLLLLAAGIVLSRFTKRGITLTIAALGIAATFINSVMPFKDNYRISSELTTEEATDARNYTDAINNRITESCGVLQLPSMRYPENGPVLDLDDYGPFWFPLTQENGSKSWSYGAVKNTEAGAWLAALPEIPGERDIQAMIEAGFCGIHVDSRAYVQPAAERINSDLTEQFGNPIATGKEGNWNLYQITDQIQPKPDQLPSYFYTPALTADTPTAANPGTVAPRGSKGDLIWWWTIAPTATFTINQISPGVPISKVSLGLRSSVCESAEATITLTDSTGTQIANPVTTPISPRSTTDITLMATEQTGSAVLTISSTGQGCMVANYPYPQFVQVIDPSGD
jgi:phosphoglycerol transferase